MRDKLLPPLALLLGSMCRPLYLPLVSALADPPDELDTPFFYSDCPNMVVPLHDPTSITSKQDNLVGNPSQPLTPLAIPVHVHAMYPTEVEKNLRSQGMSNNFTSALQEVQASFANTTFKFELASVSHYVEPDFWDIMIETNSTSNDLVGSTFGPQETTMVTKYHVGGRMDLNLYITDMKSKKSGAVLLGHAYFPWMCGVNGDEDQSRLKLDGVVVRSNWFSLGPHSAVVQSQSFGQIMAHEIGHWCGLLHSFSPSVVNVKRELDGMLISQRTKCGDPWSTDYVDDTPEGFNPPPPTKLTSTGQMCKPVDTCPGQAGMDDIDNIMSYSNCPNSRFTHGQVRRMEDMVRRWRAFPDWSAMKTEMVSTGPGFDIMSSLSWSPRTVTTLSESPSVLLRPLPWSWAALLLSALQYLKM